MESEGPLKRDGRDERRVQRLRVDFPATLGGRHSRPARVVDLSLVGCLVRSEASLDAGAVVDLRLELPDGALRTKARVAEASIDGDSLPHPSKQFLAGLEFLALAAADELRLRAFLATEARRRRGAHTRSA
jgi:PilZ domain